MKKLLMLIVAALLLSGCTTTLVPIEKGKPPAPGVKWVKGRYTPSKAFIPGHWKGYVYNPNSKCWVPGYYKQDGSWTYK